MPQCRCRIIKVASFKFDAPQISTEETTRYIIVGCALTVVSILYVLLRNNATSEQTSLAFTISVCNTLNWMVRPLFLFLLCLETDLLEPALKEMRNCRYTFTVTGWFLLILIKAYFAIVSDLTVLLNVFNVFGPTTAGVIRSLRLGWLVNAKVVVVFRLALSFPCLKLASDALQRLDSALDHEQALTHFATV